MKIMTVTGEVNPDEIGISHIHEHVYLDLEIYKGKPRNNREKEISNMKVTLENLYTINQNRFLVTDNLVNDKYGDAVYAANLFKNAGGYMLVDVTPEGVGRDPEKLVKLSKQTGVKFVAGAGYYVGISHPKKVKKWSIEQIKEEIVKDLTVGIGDTNICAGIIGEIGALDSQPTSEEARTIEAAALAQVETGASMMTHCRGIGRLNSPKKQIEIFERIGANPSKIAIAHRDGLLNNLRRDDYIKNFSELLDKGYIVSFDTFGMEGYFKHGIENYKDTLDWNSNVKFNHDSKIRYDWSSSVFAEGRDIDRVEAVMDLIQLGYIDQILISSDACEKVHHRKWGGFGWSHIIETIIPLLLSAGATQNQIDTILKKNPARLLERKV